METRFDLFDSKFQSNSLIDFLTQSSNFTFDFVFWLKFQFYL